VASAAVVDLHKKERDTTEDLLIFCQLAGCNDDDAVRVRQAK